MSPLDRAVSADRALDRWVQRAHRLRLGGRAYHPYHVATDLGIAAVIACSAVYAALVPGVGLLTFAGAFAIMQATYAAARWCKRRFLGIAARSFLQDTVLFILPSFAAASVVLGNDLRASLDLAALDLALGVAFIRAGCLVGGCCYGRPASWGVRYRAEELRATRGCRTFTPGPLPPSRVVPMQLFDGGFNLLAFAALAAALAAGLAPRGEGLPLYLCAYGCFRLVADRFRPVSARPRRAGLSEAQWTSIGVIIVSTIVLWA